MSSRSSSASPLLLLAGGGTGGHLYPALAVAQALQATHPHWQVAFVGTTRGLEARVVPEQGYILHVLPVAPLRGRSWQERMQASVMLPRAGAEAVGLIRRLKPTLALGVGGYAAGPALVASWLLGVPTWLMEQNAHAGLTNRLLAHVADRILLGLPNAQLGRHQGAQLVGNPTRQALRALREKPYACPERFSPQSPLRVVVMGGSQGARALNMVLPKVRARLEAAKLPVRFLHQTGAKQLTATQAAYAKEGVDLSGVVGYIDAMDQVLAEAHLVICRAGASTLAELAVVGRPAVLVPYPHAADDHQTANAQVWESAGAAALIPEPQLCADKLFDILTEALKRPSRLSAQAEQARALGQPEAVDTIVTAIAATQRPNHV